MQTKICRKCQIEKPATLEFFYKNPGGKFGLTPRCKPCVNEDNKAGEAKRIAADPDKIRQQRNNRSKKYYHSNIERSRERQKEHQRKARQDPIRHEKIKARKRANGAGLSPDQIEEIRVKQLNQCAICLEPEPTELDHCHSTGKVRWLLCQHCNRGLGAFFDNPSLLRKAADMLEAQK